MTRDIKLIAENPDVIISIWASLWKLVFKPQQSILIRYATKDFIISDSGSILLCKGIIHLVCTQSFSQNFTQNFSYPVIRTRTGLYQGARSVRFLENLANLLNEWSLINIENIDVVWLKHLFIFSFMDAVAKTKGW